MRSAAVSKLKATLSEYLARVKAGEEVPAHLLELARAGLVRLGSGKLPKGFWKMPRPKDPRGAVLKALLEERESGR